MWVDTTTTEQDCVVGYRTRSREVFFSDYEPYSYPAWFKQRRSASKPSGDKVHIYKGVPDGYGGNKLYKLVVDGKSVISGYQPYSCPTWFKHASQEGVDWNKNNS